MFELTVQRTFSAAHAIRIGDHVEPIHGHDWNVRATVAGPTLDSNDLLIDFHDVERWLDDIVQPFDNHHLNEIEPFDQTNPTAERVAEHIAIALQSHLPDTCHLKMVEVSEAPGCVARYIP